MGENPTYEELKQRVRELEEETNGRKQVEKTLRKSEKKYRQLFNTVSNAIMLFDAETKEFVDVNDASLNLYGYSKEEFLKLRHFDITAEPEESEDSIKQALSGEITEIPLRYHKRKDGTKFPVEISIGTFVLGNRQVVCGVIKDITERNRIEAILQEKEFIIESSSSVIATADLEGNMTYGNPTFLKTWGFDDAKEFLGRPFSEFWVVKDRLDEIMQVLQREGRWFSEDKARRKDGTLFDVQVSAATVYDIEGNPIALTSTSIDITGRKQAEKALQESEERFRYLTESSPLGVFQTDKDGSVLYLNNKWLDITGMSQQDALGFGWAQALHPEDRPRILEEWARCLVEKRGYDGEFRFVRPFEEIRWVHTRTSPVFSPAGDIISHVGVNEDITERKRAEEALQESESKFRNLFDSSPQAVALTEVKSGRLVDVNNKLCELTKYPKEEILGLNTTEVGFYLEEDRSKFLKELQASGEVNGLEMEFKAKDNSILHTLMFARIIQIEGESFILTIFHDVTEQKRLETQLQQAQKMEAIGTLAGGIAHDFNNILSSVIGYTELAIDDVKRESLLHSHLQEVLNSGLRAKDLVRQILTFSRQTDQETKPIQIKPIAKEVLKLIRASLPTTIEIKQNLQSDATVLADPTQIHQVLMNLCTNAGHAMCEKGGLLDVSLVNVELDSDYTDQRLDLKPGPCLKLTVSDTGHGMPSNVLNQIFDPFFTTKDKGEGTGMGLSVVHGIVKSHGGKITAYSKPGKGSVFNVFLPAIEKQLELGKRMKTPVPKGTERILFIDDELSLVDIGKKLLESLGYDVVTRTSSIEALELFKVRSDNFDLVITDMTMPKMTGDKLAEELLRIKPDIPIILCTGFNSMINEDKTKAMGIRAFVFKPILKRDIAETIREVLHKE